MDKSANINPFDEFDKAYQKMNQIQDEIKKLCYAGKYDEAEEKTKKELQPTLEKWRQSLKQAFKNLRKHPNFYQPKE